MLQLTATAGMSPPPDSVEVAEVARTVRRGWKAVIAFLLLGVVGAGALTLFGPQRYTAKGSVLVRVAAAEAGSGLLQKLTGIGSLPGGEMAGLGGGAIETELQVLKSSALAGRVVDSLQLQFRVRAPDDTPPFALVTSASLNTRFAPKTFSFEKRADGTYAVFGSGLAKAMLPGKPVTLEVGTVTFGSTLPDEFRVKIYDREQAIKRFQSRFTAKKAGGDVAAVSYSADDRTTAERATNTLVALYLEQRKTVDRGTNARRVEFLTKEMALVMAQLDSTERALRLSQERTGVLDVEVNGKVELEASSELRRALVDLEVQESAISSLLAQYDSGKVKARQLAALPAFLHGAGMASVMAQLNDLESQRMRLLERRTERDPEVLALDEMIKATEAGFVSTARSYATTLQRQVADMRTQRDSIQRKLMAIPSAFESGGRLQRDVLRLSTILSGVQAQLVQGKLAEIGEGGFVRQLDFAIPPRKPSFPEPWLTMTVGTLGGLLVGFVAALVLGWFGKWLRDPMEIERATGIVAERLAHGAPLLMAGTVASRTLLVVPINDQARAGLVAERLARTASSRSVKATVLDLTHAMNGNGNGSEPHAVSDVIERLEQQHAMVIVQLPGLSNEATVAALKETRPVLLVAPPGPVNRAQLESAIQTLKRLQVPCAGLVINEAVPPTTRVSIG